MSELVLYTSEDGLTRLDLRVDGQTVWLTQLEIADLFQTTKQNVSLHAKNILEEGELSPDSVVKESLTTAADGKRYKTKLYNLDLILAIGYRVRSPRGTQFRQWATAHLREFLVKGFVMDDERLKNPGGWDYFDELLARIREIRASEKRFYQKVRDLFALSSDYQTRQPETQRFFAEVQNKLLYAATRQTAAELIVARANPDQPNMALTTWSGSRVRKHDVIVAKNYLTEDEVDTLNRLVVIFLEQAELRAKQQQDLTLDYWKSSADRMLAANDQPLLDGAGTVSREEMEHAARERYDTFDSHRRTKEAAQADAEDIKALEDLEQNLRPERGTGMTTFPKYDRYKDSGVDWLGEIPEHWDVSKTRWLWDAIDDRSENGDEQLLSISQYTGVTPTTADSRSESLEGYRRCKPDDLAMNIMLAWQGGLGVSDYEGIVSPAYSVFRLKSDNNAHYLGYLYRTKRYLDEFGRNSTGIVPSRWRLYPDKFGHILTLLPPKPEQDRIVTFLDRKTAEIDALIAKKQRQIELLDEQKAILINRAVTRGLSAVASAKEGLNPKAKLKPSGIEWIGEIPEGWEILRVKNRATYFTSGSRGWGDFYADEGEVFLQSGDLTDNCTISTANAKRVQLPRGAEGQRTRLQTHDTVVCITGANTGRVANVGEIEETIYVNQHLCLVRPSKEIDHRYLSLALSGASGRTHFSLCQYGLKEGLNLDDVKNCPFPVPPLAEQRRILGFIDDVSQSIEISKASIEKQIQSLKSLRSTLIAHAVTGRIKAPQ